MIGLEHIDKLFGRRRARVAFFLLLAGIIVYAVLSVYTNNNILGWVRSFYEPPFVVNQNHFWGHQPPPTPNYADGEMNGKYVRVFNGFTFTVPLQIVNKSSRVIYIDRIAMRYDCMKDFMSDKGYSDVLPSLYGYTKAQLGSSGFDNIQGQPNPQPLFMNYQGGFTEGDCTRFVLITEREMNDMGLLKEPVKDWLGSKIAATYPLKMDANSNVFLFCNFELELYDQQGNSWRKAGGVVIDKKELEEIIVKITPIFFGEQDYVRKNATATLYTSEGTFPLRIITHNVFVGDEIWIPKDMIRKDKLKPETKQKK